MIHLALRARAWSSTAFQKAEAPEAAQALLNDSGLTPESLGRFIPITFDDKRYFEIINALTPSQREAAFNEVQNVVSPNEVKALRAEIDRRARQLAYPEFSGHSTQPRAIEPSETKHHERWMVDYDKSFIQEGVRYFPLSVAAPAIQAPRSTLVHWINKKAKFDGQPLQTYYFAPANQLFISEDSIQRAANRFIKWPSKEPAGRLTIGETNDQSGYIGLTDAARTIGIDHHTMWRWATKGTAPTDKPLDVIKCPASDQYYIREKDVSLLKKLVPRAGLRAGRRPHANTASPS